MRLDESNSNETMYDVVALFYAKLLAKNILVTFDDVT